MFLDAHNLISDAQTITTGSENGVLGTNVIDLGVAGRNIGVGENLYAVVSVDTLMAGAGDTLTVALVTAAYEALNSPTTLQTIGTFPANSAVGTKLVARIQPATFMRYIGFLYTAAGSGALEAGAFTGFLTHDVDAYTAYADNITIS
jgi:hypothetical protein